MPSALFVGGGSIGHIAPAVAVAQELKKQQPNVSISFICSKRDEDAGFLKNTSFSYTQIDAPRLSLIFPFKFLNAVKQAGNLLEVLKPNVIFSKGGYVSLPVCFSAHRKKIPIILHESDAVMGRANKLISRWASRICLGFKNGKRKVPACRTGRESGKQVEFTGNPIRSEIGQGIREEGFRITSFKGNKPILLVIGGSQGAQALNEAVEKNAEELLKLCDVIHLTGQEKKGLEERQGYWSTEFAFEELPHLYAIASVALSRAGANVIAELAANNIPTILVPLERVAHNHQLRNAEVAAQSEGFVLLRQKDLNEKLVDNIHQLLTRNAQPFGFAQDKRATSNVSPDAARHIAKILSKYLA